MGSFLQKGPLLHYQYGTIEMNKMLVLNCMVLHDAVNMVIKNIYFADKVRLLSVFSPHTTSWVSVVPSEGATPPSPVFKSSRWPSTGLL